jgi:hypothetical protein
MFDFIFGGKKKIALIRELIEQRMREEGFTEMEYRVKIKNLSNIALIGTPEGSIVTIIEKALHMQSKGYLLKDILHGLETGRKLAGHDDEEFQNILNISVSNGNPGFSIPAYARYRINLEHPGTMNDEQFANAFGQAADYLNAS